MTAHAGLADGGRPHLLPSAAIPRPIYMSAALRTVLKPTILMAGKLNEVAYDLEVGLLAKPTNPEGTYVVEITAPGYRRCPILAIGPAAEPLRIRSDVGFQFDQCVTEEIRQVAVFNTDGVLLAYGWPAPASAPKSATASIIFRAVDFSILRKR